MEVRSRSASKENLQPFCAKLSCSASDCSDATKEFGAHPNGAHAGSGSGLSSPASDASRISIDDLTPHLRCGLCREHVAGAHVLSCSHIFCGCCLADHLIASPACPACQMALRSIPVRCVAIDHVVAALLPALAPAQREAFKRRKERGESAPSIIAKMLWWLEASAPAPGGAGDPAAAASRAAPGNSMLLQHSQAAARGPNSSGAMHHHHHHHHQQMAAAGLAGALAAGAGVGGVPVGASAAHEAAMAAAMTAAAAAAAASSAAAAPGFNLSSQLGGMSLGGLGAMGGVPGLSAAHNAAAFAGLGGLRDPHAGMQLADPAVAAYQAALQSAVAMQSAHGHMMGGGYLMGM